MSDAEQDYDPVASLEPQEETAPLEEPAISAESPDEPLSADPALAEESETSLEPQAEATSAEPDTVEPKSEDEAQVEADTEEAAPETAEAHEPEEPEDEDSDYNPEASISESPKHDQESPEVAAPEEQSAQEEDDEDDYDPEAESGLPDDESSRSKTVPGQTESSKTPNTHSEVDPPATKDEQIQLFNSIIGHFITTPLLNDPTFQDLTPDQKSMVVLADYNKAKGTTIKTPINFHATTSFNKKLMRKNEDAFPLVPVNPFCKRPDIDSAHSFEFQQEYNNFLREESKWARNGRVETLPSGSRLFIGNLPVNSITKEDVYRIFRPYGEIVQISIKSGYGFVQFATAEGCNDALEGETNVPLHGKMLQLEVSKTQIKQAQQYQERQRRAAEGGADSAYRRTRSRSPSPGGDVGYKRRSPAQGNAALRDSNGNANCYIFQLHESSSIQVRKVIKALRKYGMSYKIEQDVDDVESAGNDAAYAGAIAVITVNSEDLNVKTFEKTTDGGIKFDEYTNVSAEEADSILSASASKAGIRAPHQLSGSSGGFDQKEYFKSSNRNSGGRGRNDGRGDRDRDRDRGDRDRGGRGRNNQRGRGFDNQRGGQGNGYNSNGNNQYGGYQGYPQQTMPPQGGAPPVDPASIYAQLQNYDPNTVQQVLALLGNQQQGQQRSPPIPQQQMPYGGYGQQQSPPPPHIPQQAQQYGGGYNNAPIPQQQPYGGYPQQAPQMLPQQPHSIPPPNPYGGYAAPPPPQQQQQAPPPAQQHQPPPPQQAPGASSSGSSLLEALARLKKSS